MFWWMFPTKNILARCSRVCLRNLEGSDVSDPFSAKEFVWKQGDLQATGATTGEFFWLVVWNMNFIFPYIGNFIIPIDFHIFSEGWPNHQPVLCCFPLVGQNASLEGLTPILSVERRPTSRTWGKNSGKSSASWTAPMPRLAWLSGSRKNYG